MASSAAQSERPGAPTARWDWNRAITPGAVLRILPVVALAVAAYWYPLVRWEAVWSVNDAWSYSYFVPVIALVIAHFRLEEKGARPIRPCIWGALLVLAAFVFRVWAQVTMFGYPGDVTFVLVALGLVLWLLGWEMFKVVWVSAAYLWLMIPWPDRIYGALALPAQRMAAVFAERFLLLVGIWVERAGNVLDLGAPGPITVAEACSGLRLLLAFVALGVLMAFIEKRAAWQRLLIVVSSVPIAVFCNFVRVTLMAVSSHTFYHEAVRVADGEPTWSSFFPRVVEWTSTAWIGVALIGLGVFFVIFPGGRGWLGQLASWKAAMAYVVAGVLVTLTTAHIALGYPDPAQLEDARQTILKPESAPHQAFGFAMLGLAFLLMWLELRLFDKLMTSLFIEEPDTETHATHA